MEHQKSHPSADHYKNAGLKHFHTGFSDPEAILSYLWMWPCVKLPFLTHSVRKFLTTGYKLFDFSFYVYLYQRSETWD